MSAPNETAKSSLQAPGPSGVSLRAALIGGAVAIAGIAFFGTLASNISLWVLTQRGLSVQEAYGQLFESTIQDVIGAIISAVSHAAGGFIAASIASRRFLVHGIAAGMVSLLFVAVMYATPISYPISKWMIAWTLLTPLPAAALGGYLYARRA